VVEEVEEAQIHKVLESMVLQVLGRPTIDLDIREGLELLKCLLKCLRVIHAIELDKEPKEWLSCPLMLKRHLGIKLLDHLHESVGVA